MSGYVVKNCSEIVIQRTYEEANYIIESECTVRAAAKKFGISKSTVFKDMAYRLPQIDKCLAKRVRAVLGMNKAERHIRGGIATKEKYKKAV